MKHNSLSVKSLQQLFTEARSHHACLDQAVSDDQLRALYDLVKWGPTSVNCSPARILFIKSAQEKEKLYPSLLGKNIEQVRTAPVTAIIAYDQQFYEHLPKLFPAVDYRP